MDIRLHRKYAVRSRFRIDTLSGTPAAAKEPVFRSIRCGMCGQEPAVLQDYGCRKSTAFIISQGMGRLFF